MIRKEEKIRKRGQNTYNVQKYHFRLSYDQKRRKIEKKGVKIHIMSKNIIFLLLKKDGYYLLIITLGHHYSTTSEVDRDLETKLKKWA